MDWYLIFTKPRQERCALENLTRQGYECYLPMLVAEKISHEKITPERTPLFPRYLFIRLDQGLGAKSWSPIRSTRGVSRLVSFGAEPARVDAALISHLQACEQVMSNHPEKLFSNGERVRLTGAPFDGLEAVYQMPDGERRAMVLLEFMSKPIKITVPVTAVRRII